MFGALTDAVQTAWKTLVGITYGLVLAVIVLTVAVVLANLLRRPVRRRLDKALIPENAKRLIENLVTITIFAFGFTVLLALWGVSWSALFTAIGLSTLVVALGLQPVLQSLVGGIFVLFERPYNVGDHIRFSGQDVEGTVEDIGIRTTIVRSEKGDRVVAPNALVFTNSVINHSPERARHTIMTVMGIGRADETDADLIAKITDELKDVPGLETAPTIEIVHRIGRINLPQRLDRLPSLQRRAARVRQRAIEHTTNVRVHWSGTSDSEVREEVLRRLKESYPDARISIRRW